MAQGLCSEECISVAQLHPSCLKLSGEKQLGSEAKRGRKEEDTAAQTLWKMEDTLAKKAG